MLISEITLTSVDRSFIIYRKSYHLQLKKKQRSKGGTLLKYLVAKERYIVKAVNHVYVLITFNVRPHERQYIC